MRLNVGTFEPSPPRRTLVFDFETKPGAYWYDDTTTTLVCAWAAKWLDEDEVTSYFMVPDWIDVEDQGDAVVSRWRGMLLFSARWAEADQVVTHNGKRFDLPIINGALDRLALPPLAGGKTHIDTLCDRRGSKGAKRSLEALAERYKLSDAKLSVTSETWERAYEFEPAAIQTVLERAESDVRLTEELYLTSIDRGVLR